VNRTRAWPYLTPFLLTLGVWVYGPAGLTLALSFLDWNLTTPIAGITGLDHYLALFAHPEFVAAAGQTVLYALALLPFSTVIPLGLAVLLWQRPSRASTAYRSLLFLPAIMAPVAVAMAWRFLLNPLQGLANELLRAIGLAPVNWLGDPRTALPTIAVITAAKVTAFTLLLYSAALAAVDRRTVEAARLEGATATEIAGLVVIPQITRTAIMVALLSLLLAGQWTFANVSVLTQGGPDGTTDNLFFRIYTLGFQFFDIGEASAASVILLLVVGALAVGWRLIARGRTDAG
jgi:multiple sugar transport system permease protein